MKESGRRAPRGEFLGARLGEADAGDLRAAIGAAGNIGPVDRVQIGLAGNFFDAENAFVAGLWASQGGPARSPMA